MQTGAPQSATCYINARNNDNSPHYQIFISSHGFYPLQKEKFYLDLKTRLNVLWFLTALTHTGRNKRFGGLALQSWKKRDEGRETF